MAEQKLKRLNVTINEETDAALNEYVQAKGVTKTEALRRLIMIGDFVSKADNAGDEITIKGKGKEAYRLRII